MPDTEIIQGDCREVMATLPENCVDSIVTDPPYGLSFMGKGWDHSVPGTEFWEAALRVAKPGAHLLAFGGTRLFHRLAVAIEDAGWEIRDTLMWVYSQGFPKSHNGDWGGTALKPAYEPIIMARKPLIGTVAANFERYGVGGLNIDGCRVGTEVVQINVRNGWQGFGNADHKDGYEPKHVRGRWPANLIHDGSEEVVAGFPETAPSTAQVRHNKPSENIAMAGANLGHISYGHNDSGSAARFFYCAKASKRDRDEGCEGLPLVQHQSGMGGAMPVDDDGKDRDRFKAMSRNHHPTVKPTDLMAYLCRLVTPKGGVVLDPFCGSGSTGKAAVREGFDFLGIELDPEYVKIAEARVRDR